MSVKKIKTVEGKWDCAFCGTKNINGLTKICPACNRPMGDKLRYYVENYDEAEGLEESKIPQGPEWECRFCGAYNKFEAEKCWRCEAPKENVKDYFEVTGVNKEDNKEDEERPEETKEENKEEIYQPKGFLGTKLYRYGVTFLILFGLAFGAYKIFSPKEKELTLVEKYWERIVSVETYKTVKESDWGLPSQARVYDSKEEIHHYEEVFDHNEQVEVTKTREVQDGETCYTESKDNGNGTFSVYEHCSPKYKTETYTAYENKPIYRKEPVYQTKYYYEIDKWVEKEKLKASGSDNNLYWNEDYELKENERLGDKSEKYILTFKEKLKKYIYNSTESEYLNHEVGKKYKVKIQVGKIAKLVN